MGHAALGMFISAQGDGDLGESVMTDDGTTLRRSTQPVRRPLQTVFGLFDIDAYVYARGPKKKIELRPVDTRMALPNGHASYLFEEFSQYFCVEQAFDRSLEAIARVLRQSLSKDTLERINRRVGEQAEAYLDELSAPPAEHEGELLVVTGDGKGVPLVKPELASVPIFDPEERRGNRRMATLASVYSVDRFVRRPEDIVAVLFRDQDERPERAPRPKPVGKQLTARFARERDFGNGPEYVSGPIEAFSWASRRVAARLQPDQPLIALMDGAPSSGTHCTRASIRTSRRGTAPWMMTKLAARAMRREGSGSIINIASIAGMIGRDRRVYPEGMLAQPLDYAAAKGGLIAFTRDAAADLGRDGIRVNAISPGGIERNQPDEFIRGYSSKTILGRMGRAVDLKGAVVFLASDAAA